jgi:hypothetical protein
MKRSISLILLMILAFVVCQGQTCAPASSTPTEAGPTVIPGGTYAGELAATVKILLNGGVQQEYAANVPFTVTFKNDGVLLIPTGVPLYVGYSQTLLVGQVTLNITVTSLETTATGLTIGYSVVATMAYEGNQITLNGTGQIGYSVEANGTLTASMTFDTAYTLLVTVGVHIDVIGTLTPQ